MATLRSLTDEQRREKCADAASDGDVARLEALHTLGFDVATPVLDSYGQRALLLAATNGHTDAVHVLLRHRSDPDARAHGGVSAVSAAAAHGHAAVLSALAGAGADLGACGSEGLAPVEYALRRACRALPTNVPEAAWPQALTRAAAAARVDAGDTAPLRLQLPTSAADAPAASSPPLAATPSLPAAHEVPNGGGGATLVRLVASDAKHPAAGSCYIDGGVPEATLCLLERLYDGLPIAPRVKCTQGLSDRAYFCDAEGWVSEALGQACAAGARSAVDAGEAADLSSALPCKGEAVVQMRYLIYAEAGGGLPPHTDLSRTRRDGAVSKCTFLLYLTDCDVGGKTVLLDKLPHEAPVDGYSVEGRATTVLAAVTPKRGRLLLFPHMAPHRADAVVAEGLPKTLLRGEVV